MQGLLSQSRILNSSIFGAGGSNIKSIQTGLLNATSVSNNVNITAADKNKSIAKLNIRPSLSSTAVTRGLLSSIKFNSNTQINIAYNTSETAYPLASWTVTEYNNVKSKQEGSVSLQGADSSGITTTDITVSTIDLNKYELYCSFRTTFDSTQSYTVMHRYYMKDSTTLTVEWTYWGTANWLYIEWQLIEFN